MAAKGILYDFIFGRSFDKSTLVSYVCTDRQNIMKSLLENRGELMKYYGIDRTVGPQALKEGLARAFSMAWLNFCYQLWQDREFELLNILDKAGRFSESDKRHHHYTEYLEWCTNRRQQNLLREKYLKGSVKIKPTLKGSGAGGGL